MLENANGVGLGDRVNCLEAWVANSRAMISPSAVTVRAVSLIEVGIVISGVLSGKTFDVITRPAIILPQASRLIGFKTSFRFSLIGESALNRGWPMVT